MSECKTHAGYLKCDISLYTDILTALDYSIIEVNFYKWGKAIKNGVVWNFKGSSYWCAFSFLIKHPSFFVWADSALWLTCQLTPLSKFDLVFMGGATSWAESFCCYLMHLSRLKFEPYNINDFLACVLSISSIKSKWQGSLKTLF